MKEKYNTISEMYESKQFNASKAELDKNHNLSKEICSLKLKLRKQEQELRESKAKVRSYKEEIAKANADCNTKVDASVIEDMTNEIETLKEENKSLRMSLRKFRMNNLDNDVSRNSRFESVKRNVIENRKPTMEKPFNRHVETKSMSEDDKMEMMLNGNLNNNE